MPAAVDIARAIAAGQDRCVDHVRFALRRRHELDGWLRAFVDHRDETAPAALALAAEASQSLAAGQRPGPLAGVPIAVKGRRGPVGAQAEALRAAGAIIVGATATPRGPGPQTWGHTQRGPTRNPWRADLSPGGSSAGSAAAVAAGIVPLATGSDGAGSSRIPAAWCGIFGYKPTAALAAAALTASGPLAVPAVPAPLARDPRDLQVWADVVLGAVPASRPPRTAAWSADLGYAADLDPDVVAIARAAAEHLVSRLGLEWVKWPVRLRDPGPAWSAFRDPTTTAARLAEAQTLRATNDRELARLFAAADVMLTPTTPGPAHGHAGPGTHLSVALTWAFNVSDHPAVSVPAGFAADRMPVGLQLVTRPGDDRILLDLAATCAPAPVAPGPSTWS